ncbi:MAG: hypothetical protein PHX78_10690 [bacterium]|nr:hypothetical protein [bacterium]
MKLLLISIAVIILNLPFGYWRGKVKKFSLQWFLAIHLPIPFIVLLRIFSGLGFAFITYPVMLGADIIGQIIGAKIYIYKHKIAKG